MNPIPPSGWGWGLSEYEVRYVEKFGIRPLRDPSGTSDLKFEERLDREAEVILNRKSRSRLPSHIRRRTAVALLIPLFLIGGYFTFMAVQTFVEATQITADAEELESRIHD